MRRLINLINFHAFKELLINLKHFHQYLFHWSFCITSCSKFFFTGFSIQPRTVCVCVHAQKPLRLNTAGLLLPKGVATTTAHHCHHIHNGDKINLLSPPLSLPATLHLLYRLFSLPTLSPPTYIYLYSVICHLLCLFVSLPCYSRPGSSLQPLLVSGL